MAERSTNDFDVDIGTRIRVARLARGLSQGELGAAVGVTFQQIQKYEKGANRIAGSRVLKICAALGITVEQIFKNLDHTKQSKPLPSPGMDFLADPVGSDIAKVWFKLKPKDRQMMRSIAHHFAG